MNYFQPHFILLYFIRVTNARRPSSAANSNQISNIQSFDYTSGQSYKASTIIIYVPDLKIPHITTLES